MENKMQERQRCPKTMPEKISSRKDAWNFDFDDNESDGADVAAFEYADSHKVDEDFPQARQSEGENNRRSEEGFHKSHRPPMAHEREFSVLRPNQPGTAFDDEDDDLESYELDRQSREQSQKTASIDFSELEVDSDSDDIRRAPRTSSPRNVKASKPRHRNAAFSGSEVDELDFGSDEEVSVHRNWKSSRVADSRQRTRGRGAITYGSDEDVEPSSESEDVENFRSRQNKGNKWGSSKRDFGRRASCISEDFSWPESDRFRRDKGTKPDFDSKRNVSKGRGGFDVSENSGFKSRGMMRDRKSPSKDRFDRSAHGPVVMTEDFAGMTTTGVELVGVICETLKALKERTLVIGNVGEAIVLITGLPGMVILMKKGTEGPGKMSDEPKLCDKFIFQNLLWFAYSRSNELMIHFWREAWQKSEGVGYKTRIMELEDRKGINFKIGKYPRSEYKKVLNL